MNDERVDVTVDVVFPNDTDEKNITFLNMQDGAEAARHDIQNGTCLYCGITEFSGWRVHGGRDKDLCLARTDLYRDWARLFHEGEAVDPTGKILAYVLLSVAEPWLRAGGLPKRLSWIKVVPHPTKHVACVLLLSGYPSATRIKKRSL